MDDVEDPHDLAFPSAHFARQSVVDNLVMSLDRVSPTGSHEFSRVSPRKTRHQTHSERSRAHRDPLATIFGEDEDSHRAKAYGAQRAAQAVKSKQQERPSARSRSSSNSSSVDLGHLASFAGRLGPAGNRRSQSFDFGSTRPPRPLLDAVEISSPPRVFPGPASDRPNASSPSAVPQRKSSGRSAKTATQATATRTKRRSGTVGANTVRPRHDSPQALPPIKNLIYDNTDRKLPPTPTVENAAAFSRPGFFKRVFGSSKTPVTGTSSGTSTPVPQMARSISRDLETPRPSTPQGKPAKQSAKPPGDPSSNKENQPVVTKKPSSFFRRRKKSISTGVPPPLPLTLNSWQSEKQADAPSPVSSLKALMDPYLATEAEHRYRHARGGSIHSITNVTPKQGLQRNLDAEFSKATSKHSRRPSARSLTKIEIPVKSPILANSAVDDTSPKMDKLLPPQPTTSTTIHDHGMSPGLATSSMGARDQKSPRLAVDPVKAAPTDRTSPATSGRPASPTRRQTHTSFTSEKAPHSVADSDASIYRSAPSTPIVQDLPGKPVPKQPHVHVSQPSVSEVPALPDNADKARRLYQNPEDELVGSSTACAWLGDGDSEREGVRKAYMEIFDWTGQSILASLRSLCHKMVLKGETQQVDRIIEAFSHRWCVCNSNHGFKSSDVVHTICYSILLLNTDLHLADIGQKMTRTQFIRNAMLPIRAAAAEAEQVSTPQSSQFLAVRTNSHQGSSISMGLSVDSQGRSASALSSRASDRVSRDESREPDTSSNTYSPLVDAPHTGSQGGWEVQVETVLKQFYTAISRDPLPLFGQTSKLVVPPGTGNMMGMSGLRRTPSTLSKAHSEARSRNGLESKSVGARWARKTASRVRLGPQPFGSSRTSLDDGSSNWSPLSSTWSKVSLGKTLTSMSVDSFGTEHAQADYQSSIGFANALSQAIIRDEQLDMNLDEGLKATPLLEDESLELHGAPWAKEGMVKHKCHLEGVDKRSRDRNWSDCFAVIDKGWMRLFSFSVNAKTVRNKTRTQKAGGVVGGGNWQDNAEEVWKFMLRHTIASTLPPPGYSKQRPFVWALSLPNGAVHLFSVGTPDIVKEFVSTANFWSARLSKEPIAAGVSSMEYGWSDNVINRALVASESHVMLGPGSPRPSTQLSLRSSLDHGAIRSRLPGDKVHISEWNTPQQSLTPSQLMEVDQHKALQNYVKNVEDEFQKHNELRPAMLIAFTSRHPNAQKAMANWEKKSSYLLHEIVKFSTYIDALNHSQKCKEKVYKMREEDKAAREEDRIAREAEKAAAAV